MGMYGLVERSVKGDGKTLAYRPVRRRTPPIPAVGNLIRIAQLARSQLCPVHPGALDSAAPATCVCKTWVAR